MQAVATRAGAMNRVYSSFIPAYSTPEMRPENPSPKARI